MREIARHRGRKKNFKRKRTGGAGVDLQGAPHNWICAGYSTIKWLNLLSKFLYNCLRCIQNIELLLFIGFTLSGFTYEGFS